MTVYRSRISGPLRDRIDLHVEVPALPSGELLRGRTAESSTAVAKRVAAARSVQADRISSAGGGGVGDPGGNAELDSNAVRRWCRVQGGAARLLEDASDRLVLSPRGIHKLLKVARTIADLEGGGPIAEHHVAEAVQYRELGVGRG